MMDRVLVTGTSGLVGYQVAERMQAAGADVLGIDRRAAPAAASFRHVVGDVASLDTMLQALAGRSLLVHAGAVSGPMLLLDDPHAIAQANLGGAMAVFEAARRQGVRRLVWASSIAVYGDQPTLAPVPEDAALNPQSFYAHTKAAGEALLHGYVTGYGLNAVALRISSVYGVRRQTACNLNAVIEAGLQRRPAAVPAAGSSFRQYIHVDDAARAVALALAAEAAPGFVYNVTGGSYESEFDLGTRLARLVPGLVTQAGPPAWNEGHLGPLLIDAAARDLGYRPAVALQDGLAELVRHLAAAA